MYIFTQKLFVPNIIPSDITDFTEGGGHFVLPQSF